MPYDLDSPILANGIKNTHYFNGRLLTAQDLQNDQSAQRQQRQQLGRAIGHGIVQGLEVTLGSSGSTPVVRVTPGLAFNRLGQALEIKKVPETLAYVEVALLPETEESARDTGLFATCSPPQTDVLFNGGVFILVIEPASGFEEKAPMHEFNGNGTASTCGSRYAVEGVQFRLVNVALNNPSLVPASTAAAISTALNANTVASLSRARNMLAQLCLDTRESTEIGQNLVAYVQNNAPPAGLLERLASLTACAVPLALIYWHQNGIRILDMWSVRRRLTQVDTSLVWPPPTSDHHLAEGEALFLQFQQHLATLLKTGSGLTVAQLTGAAAADYFQYLPPAGILPLSTAVYPRGFNYIQFFADLTTNTPEEIEYAHVESLLRRSFAYPPVNIQTATEFYLYRIHENQVAAANGGATGPQQYLVFTSAHMPFLGEISTGDEPLVITKLTPSGTVTDPIITSQPLQIEGGNFRYSVGAQRVSLDGLQITNYDHLLSNDFNLVVNVPKISGLPENGRDMVLRVDNGLDSVSQTVHVAPPEQILQGNVDVLWNDNLNINPNPNPVMAGGGALVGYVLKSRASAQADFVIAATITDVNWQSELILFDENQDKIDNNMITLDQGEERPFYIRIVNIPATAGRDPFRLTVTAQAEQVVGSNSRVIPIGVPVEPPDNTITVAFNTFQAFTAAGGLDTTSNFNPATNTVNLQNGSFGLLSLVITFEQTAAIYDVTLARTGGSAGWLMGLESIPSAQSPQTLLFDERNQPMPVNENLNLQIQVTADASTSGELSLRVQRRNATQDQTVVFRLNRIG